MRASDSGGLATANSQKNLRTQVNAAREPRCLLSVEIAGMARSYRRNVLLARPVATQQYVVNREERCTKHQLKSHEATTCRSAPCARAIAAVVRPPTAKRISEHK